MKRLIGILGWLGVALVVAALILRFYKPDQPALYQGLAYAGLAVTLLYAASQNPSIRAQPYRLCVIQSGYCQLRSLPRKSGHRKRCARQRGSPGSRLDAVNRSTIPKENGQEFGAHTVFGRAAQPVEFAPFSSFWRAIRPVT